MKAKKVHVLKLNATEFHFLNMLLNEVQLSQFIREGHGFRMYAWVLQRKINGKSMPRNMHDGYKKAVQVRVLQQMALLDRRLKESCPDCSKVLKISDKVKA